MKANLAVKNQNELNHLTKEAKEILAILDQIEDRTADLRKKLIEEFKSCGKTAHLELDKIEM